MGGWFAVIIKRYRVGSGEWQCEGFITMGRVYYMQIRPMDLKKAKSFTSVIDLSLAIEL